MKELDQLKILYPQDLEQRKNWYSNVAEAYNKVRPRYPKELINRAVEVAQIPAEAAILELGCGPGIAIQEVNSGLFNGKLLLCK